MSPLHATMFDAFAKAAKERAKRLSFVPDPLEPRLAVPEWVLFEREQMLKAVNAERVKRGWAPVDLPRLYREERQAYGHSDYHRKYALYCANLASEP